MRSVLLLAVTAALVATMAEGSCKTFYYGLCEGPNSCMCTLGEACGTRSNATVLRKDGSAGCSGSCRTVVHDRCRGPNDCMLDAGSCGGPAPPGPGPAPPSGGGRFGGDVAVHVPTSDWSCAVRAGWSFMMVRSYHSYGAPDSNAAPTLQAAAAAGLTDRGVYHFPCAYGKGAAQQVQDDVNAVGSSNFNRLWFDIETNPSPGCGWKSDQAANCQFLTEMIQAGEGMGIQMGVYASSYMWDTIMGSGCTVGASKGLPVWYAGYDGSPSFNDWHPFGGWSTPAVHQYADHIGISCGFQADANWAQ